MFIITGIISDALELLPVLMLHLIRLLSDKAGRIITFFPFRGLISFVFLAVIAFRIMMNKYIDRIVKKIWRDGNKALIFALRSRDG